MDVFVGRLFPSSVVLFLPFERSRAIGMDEGMPVGILDSNMISGDFTADGVDDLIGSDSGEFDVGYPRKEVLTQAIASSLPFNPVRCTPVPQPSRPWMTLRLDPSERGWNIGTDLRDAGFRAGNYDGKGLDDVVVVTSEMTDGVDDGLYGLVFFSGAQERF